MSNNSEVKIVLLLTPQRMLKDHVVLESLHIHKNGRSVDYIINQLDNGELRRFYSEAPSTLKLLLASFREEAVAERAASIKKRHAAQRAGISFEVYFINAMLREMHELFDKIKRHAESMKWYHKIKADDKFKTGPCSVYSARPSLSFEVVKEKELLQLKTNIVIDHVAHPLQSFNRFHFLLEKENVYYVMGFKDYQTLEWLVDNDPAQYSSNPELLATQILSRLEPDYPVNRNGLFSQNHIEVVPVNRVMLSEISGSFLVLTPQWLYESFVIEGEWKETFETVKNGEGYVVKRNAEAEDEFRKLLLGLHPNFSKQVNGYYYLPFAEAQKKQWFLKVYHQLLDGNIQVIGMDMLNHFRYSPHKIETKIKITENDNETLDLQITILFGKEEVPLADLQKMLLAGQKAILLKDGSLGVPGHEWLQQYGIIIKHGKISGKVVTVARWMAMNEQESATSQEVLKPILKNAWWEKWTQWLQPGSSVYEVPAAIKATLRPYQKKGYEWMRLLAEVGAGACLADDMGLGKTLQTISFIVHQVSEFPQRKNVIICPSSLVYNWLQELQKFAPHLKASVYHGAQRNFELMASADDHLIITTYGTLRSDIDKLSSITFGVAVIDESHNIKNPAALITRAVNQLNAINRIALSGTPVMNNTFDLYAQLSFLLPGMFGSREFFKSEYADAIDRDRDPEKIQTLQRLTAPFILRRTKEQVASDLPDKIESVLWCQMGADQWAAYESIKEKVRSSIFLDIKEKGLGSGKLSVINGMLKLRQVCNSCALVKDEDLFTYDSVKTDILVAELQNIIVGHKALVFSQFTSMLDLLEESFKKHQIVSCRLDGSTPMELRQELVNNFQKDDSKERVFLISLKAGNAGLNLTAADYVFLFDPWWNTAVQQQAIDRTHRIGQTKNVFAYKMICKDTIEEKIIKLQERKKQLADDLVGGEEGFVKSLGMDDIEFLFS
ncbi:MAG: DEAD/DEAH box helicase [Bacteroidota bacterium]